MTSKEKLPTSRWLANLKEELIARGWATPSISYPSAKCMFYQCMDGLILSLIVETSRRYKETFTASFYLGQTFSWPLAGGDCPPDAYRRIGDLLRHEEYGELNLAEPRSTADVDAWWTGYSSSTLSGLVEAISRGRTRFLAQPGLAESVNASATLSRRFEDVSQVRKLAPNEACLAMPANVKKNPAVPAEWYSVATRVLGDRVTPERVKWVAEDAWNYENTSGPCEA